jgi:hypothetical protein
LRLSSGFIPAFVDSTVNLSHSQTLTYVLCGVLFLRSVISVSMTTFRLLLETSTLQFHKISKETSDNSNSF